MKIIKPGVQMKALKLSMIFVFLFSGQIFAETIELKSGRTIEAKILEKTNDYVKVDYDGIAVTFYNDEIKSIAGQSYPATSGGEAVQEASKKDSELLSQMKAAQSKVTRTRVKIISRTEMTDAFRMELEQVSEVDFNNKIMHAVTQAKNIEYILLNEEAMKKKIEEARQKGSPQETIDKMESILASLPESMKRMSDSMKKMLDNELYLVDTKQYIRVMGNKWFRIEKSKEDMDSMWQLLAKMKSGQEPAAMDKLSNVLTQTKGIEDLFAGGYNLYDFNNVSEADFQGKPCFVINIKSAEAKNMANRMLAKTIPGADAQAQNMFDINSYTGKMFISKEDYLILGAAFDMSANGLAGKDSTMSTKVDMEYSYPQENIQIPQGIDSAVPVKDEEELKIIISQELMSSIKDSLPKPKAEDK